MRLVTIIILGIFLSLLACFFNPVQAERATQTEMELVCQNWLSYMVYQKGTWAGETHPQIMKVDEITEGDTLLARCFSIAPHGFVAVPILKELPPIMAYSDEYPLDEKQAGGFSLLLKEVLLDRIRLFAKAYGSLDAIQPPTGDVLMGRGQKAEWTRFLKTDQEFKTDLNQGKFQPLTEAGPLLTTSWHQRAPYNEFCPMGDGGRCVVGCVATATAQILRYWSRPNNGIGSHSYTWDGDYSCGGSTPPQNLYADYSDPYDWQNMPDSCDFGCAPEDTAALAELCYEVGVAFEMDYGKCGSGAYTRDAEYVFPTYFGYDTSINVVDRYNYSTPAEWFSIIQAEINQGRPIQYRIRSHSIVCDGWRDTGGQNQYHMNYGWGGSFTTWFAIDSLYCYWVLPDSLCPPDEEYLIRNIIPPPPDTIPFASALNYPTGDSPLSVFCADLDGDRDLDLAVVNEWDNNVSILKNNGDGTFQSTVNYGTGDTPLSVFCADLDGDGDLDLAVANYNSGNISILMNNGDGTFQSAVNYGAGFSPWSIFCADLDGDCDLDLAMANPANNHVSILKNNGDGTFQSASNYWVGSLPFTIFCADLDGDGDLDLAVTNYNSGNISILKNNGDGTFQSAVNYGAGDYPYYIFCADLDGDTDLDLAVANSGRYYVSILKNNGDGTFQSAVNYGVGDSPRSVFCADLDGDTDLDLVTTNDGSNIISILKNNGDGTFQNRIVYGESNDPLSVFCADLDGDSDLDLAVANFESDSVSIFRNLTQVPGNSPPYPFSLISLVDGNTTLNVVKFDWVSTQDVNLSDQVRYDLYLSATPSYNPDSTAVYDSLVCSQLIDTLHVGMYYWKVKAYDNWGAERWSTQTWEFQVVQRGDVNGDRIIDVGDVVYLINYLFKSGTAPNPLAAGDVTCDSVVDIGDVVFIINYLFKNGPPPGC